MTGTDTWLTLAQASTRHGKSIATIRRWLTLTNATVRTEMRHGTRYVHAGDVAKVADTHPAPIDAAARAACAEAGHPPDPDALDALGDLGDGDWVTLGVAGRTVARSKSTLTLWIRDGELRSVPCTCQWRRYVLTTDLEHADNHHFRRGARHDQ